MARLLAEGELREEARGPLLDAILAAGRAFAVENRVLEPASAEEALRAPLVFAWKSGVEDLRTFVGEGSADWKAPLNCLDAALTR